MRISNMDFNFSLFNNFGWFATQPNNMVIMDNYYAQDHLQEIWQKIDQLHLSYLEMEESPEKLDQRNKIEDCISEFLCIAAHNQKFYFRETEEVLQRSASSKKDFSGYKAATGWNAIQLYAGNLLSQPWRKEYRTIKTYSGFYKHQIEANLVGAELMFEAMGYKHAGNGILVLDGPICPDRVANVSKDSLVAYVECQILKAVWEEVSTSFNVTWLEVLEFRKVHYCSPEHAVKALKYQHHQKQFEHSRSYPQGSHSHAGKLVAAAQRPPVTAAVPPAAAVLPANHSFPPLGAHHGIPQNIPPPPVVYSNGCCVNTMQKCTCVQHGFGGYVPYVAPPVVKPQCGNGYCYSNGYVAPVVPTAYRYPVPTAQLIELDSHNGYDMVDTGPGLTPGHSRLRKASRESAVTNEVYRSKNNNDFNLNGAVAGTEKEDAQYEEDWDYVYRNLESQGYSKDLGERGDLLSPPATDKRRHSKDVKKVKSTNLEEAMNSLAVSDRPLRVTEAVTEKKHPETKPVERRNSQSSSYDNLTPNDVVRTAKVPSKANASSYARTKTLPRDKEVKEQPKNVQSKTLDLRKLKEEKVPQKKEEVPPPPSRWQCMACTYLNEGAKDICEMCSKSRSPKQEQPMEVGGSECSKCTLVNPKNLKVCEACGASLKNSPTYI